MTLSLELNAPLRRHRHKEPAVPTVIVRDRDYRVLGQDRKTLLRHGLFRTYS